MIVKNWRIMGVSSADQLKIKFPIKGHDVIDGEAFQAKPPPRIPATERRGGVRRGFRDVPGKAPVVARGVEPAGLFGDWPLYKSDAADE